VNVKDFRDLDVWKRAHQLVLELYKLSEVWPKSESFGLTHQVRRSSMSLATRIAEGCGRDSDTEFAFELRKAKSVASELEYLVLLAHDLGHLGDEDHRRVAAEVVEVRKMVSGLLRKL
jgi:four helix bundle protein